MDREGLMVKIREICPCSPDVGDCPKCIKKRKTRGKTKRKEKEKKIKGRRISRR